MAKTATETIKDTLDGVERLLDVYTEYGYDPFVLEETVQALRDCYKRVKEEYRKRLAKE